MTDTATRTLSRRDQLAHQHATWGLHVFPLRENDKPPLGGHGHHDATNDPDAVLAARAGHPNANIGWALTASNLLVVDIDATGDAAQQAVATFTASYGDLPPTLTTTTASGGRHLIYRVPNGLDLRRAIRVGGKDVPIDLLGDGYIVAPGSVVNGVEYTRDDTPVADATQALIDLATRDPAPSVTPTPSANGTLPEPERRSRILRALASEEKLHDGLLAVGRAVVDRPEEEHESIAATAVNVAAALRSDGGRVPSLDEARRAIRDGAAWAREHGLKAPTAPGDEAPTPRRAPWPEPMGDEAFIGPIGEFARAVEPTTEAQVEPILVQSLALSGCALGPVPAFHVGATRHPGILHVVNVGNTSRARKGTAADEAERLIRKGTDFDLQFEYGLSSGEGLIDAFRYEEGQPAPDPRRAIIEGEFASVLRVMGREGNTLSAVLRNAWDGKPLGTLTRANPVRVQSHHLAVIGAVTFDELRRDLTPTAITNGLVNRILWVVSKRAQVLPNPPAPVDLAPFKSRLTDAHRSATFLAKPVRATGAYQSLWQEVYGDLTRDVPGALGAATARAEAQVQRLALVYSLLDCADARDEVHLRAALEVWRYCRDSAAYLFGSGTGDALADRFLAALQEAGAVGLTKTELRRQVVGNRMATDRIDAALSRLEEFGYAERSSVKPATGKSIERWAVR